jgi:hypothetical protein
MNPDHSADHHNTSRWLLAAAAISFLFQLLWFGAKCFHQIDIDGMDYIGIAATSTTANCSKRSTDAAALCSPG